MQHFVYLGTETLFNRGLVLPLCRIREVGTTERNQTVGRAVSIESHAVGEREVGWGHAAPGERPQQRAFNGRVDKKRSRYSSARTSPLSGYGEGAPGRTAAIPLASLTRWKTGARRAGTGGEGRG